ncbi:LytR/AlgR family response regulator transcription factor [Flavihumibacter petaseus]|uniref:Putative two-component response regulator n=1 Tax=Flavihumibacter petaseus NBRC 106054 TaxID=1220578 RepID=A0A0E9MXA0_9BACT|nr:LytTR family DNA-binding domain-containing protein [Flavihumibacter petaseus]GAO42234.1 putative two-component response regulator [Flavihumibacter petaseus NBRC 106054]
MKILIIEDEKPAAERLFAALQGIEGQHECLATLESVREAVAWLSAHLSPDLIFMDIELSDGQSFSIFDQVTISCPVIFTTAYDEYWQEAFEYNSIEYLLKPIRQERLQAALQKYATLKQHFAGSLEQLRSRQQQPAEYRKRYLIKRGSDYVSIKTEQIAYCYAAHKLVCIVDDTGQRYLLDKSLSDLEKELNPDQFFRVNRKYLAHINAISRLRSPGKGKLLVEFDPPAPEEVAVSTELILRFKEWMDA